MNNFTKTHNMFRYIPINKVNFRSKLDSSTFMSFSAPEDMKLIEARPTGMNLLNAIKFPFMYHDNTLQKAVEPIRCRIFPPLKGVLGNFLNTLRL